MGQATVIVLRLAQGVQSHFAVRRSEWALAFGMAGWGYVISKPAAQFATSPSYSAMADMAPEYVWGAGALTVGLLRIVALVVNGTFPGTIYARYSPGVRGVMAYLACFVWTSITLGLFASPNDAPGSYVYLAIAVLDFFNGRSAMHDQGVVYGARKNGVT